MIAPKSTIAINPSSETIRLGPLSIRFLVTGSDSGGSAAVFECAVPAGEKLRAPAHSHDAYEETVYGLEGILTWTVDGRQVEVGPAEALCIPRGIVHRFDNYGPVEAKVLMVASPALIGPEYFREVAALMADGAGSPPDPQRMGELLRRYGLTPVMPGA